jgi:EmrB/QacA subfamily drug resistance transporter
MSMSHVERVQPIISGELASPIGFITRPRHDADAPRRPSPNLVLAIVCVGIVLANLDLFIVNVALPNIGRDFPNASLENLSWILNAYAVVYAAFLVFFGRLAEGYRRDRSFLLGVVLFTIASAACAMANSVESLVVFRVGQAAGAALMTPTSLGLLLSVFPPEKRGAAVRTWTAIGGLGAALGPLVGGALVTLNWRLIFLVNIPIGIAALLVGWWKLPKVSGHDAPKPHPLDAALVTGGTSALVFAIVKVNDWGWTSPEIGVAAGVAIVLLTAFVWRCFHSVNPFVDPALFRIRQFSGASLVMAPYSAAFGAMLLSVALWEQTAWGWSALQTGLVIAPGPLMVPITSLLFAGRLIKRFGPAPIISAGIVTFAGGLIWYALAIGPEPSALTVVIGMIPTGIGVGLTFPTLMGVSSGALPPSAFATGSGVINMVRQASLAIGVAIFIAVVGSPASLTERVAAFHLGWWVFVAIMLSSLVPALALIRPKRGRRLAGALR